MTPVRSPRGRVVHLSHDLRRTLGCNKKCDGWIVAVDEAVTCLRCHIASTTN